MPPRLAKDKWLNGVALILIALICILLQKLFIPTFDLVAGNLISGASTDYITKGNSISQPFISNKNGLSAIHVYFLKQDIRYPKDAVLTWELLSGSDNNSLLAQGKIPIGSIKNESFYALKFDALKNSRLNHYILKFSSPLDVDGIAISSSPVSQSQFYSYQANGKAQVGTIVFHTGYSAPGFNSLIILRGLISAIPLWILFLFREKLIITFEEKPLHLTVTIVIVSMGLLMIIIQPPLHMFDEPEHFRRVWEVSTGKLIPSTNDGQVSTRLPEYIQSTLNRVYRSVNGTTQNPIQIIHMLSEPAGAETELSEINGLISTYSFLAYLLPAFFVRVGIWLGSSALGLTYLARLANLIQFAFLTYWAIKHATVGRQTIALVALLGLIVTQGVAINVDSLMMGGSFLFLAAAFNLIWAEDGSPKITKKEILPLIIGAICILISKHIYIPILFLVTLIPTSRFENGRNKWKWVLLFLLIAGIFSILLQLIITPGNDPRLETSGIAPLDQLGFIMRSPISWLRIFSMTMINKGFGYYNQFNLLNGTYMSIGIFGLVQLAVVLFFSWSENDSLPARITTWHRIYALFVVIITSMFVMLPLYLYWTPVGAPDIDGIQGRYFLPIIVILLTVLRPQFAYSGKYIKTKLLATMTGLLLLQVWMTYSFFY